MRWLGRILPLALVFGLAAGAAEAGATRPIVVELFTSQGCSSCPPADILLAKLTQKPGVIPLSLPITYWDMLGWKDTLASEANTHRQKAYATAMGHGGVYTPQMIVDGVSDVVGSRAAQIEAVIAERRAQMADARAQALAQAESRHLSDVARAELVSDLEREQLAARTIPSTPPRGGDPVVPVMIRETPQEMHIDIAAVPGVQNATVWMFPIRSAVSVTIPSGENAGRTIVYHNVSSDPRAIGVYKGKALSLSLPRASAPAAPADSVAVVVQLNGYGHIVGAAYVSRPDYYAAQ
jgi:hypothetical protein